MEATKRKVLNKVTFFHFRRMNDNKMQSHGGVTICFRPEEKNGIFGLALCSNKEHYNKKTGRAKSLGRTFAKDEKFKKITNPISTLEELYENACNFSFEFSGEKNLILSGKKS